ncbi:hypothetical protein [Massilia suwonensis]|uniref:Uncharacterized protein n=1 Tax=Massilia suwonensis TaxID=648895 RepID=A0ABW0MKR8_9BURK
MPEFSWEPLDFLEALEVVPIEKEYGISFRYLFAREAYSLDLTIHPMAGDVALLITCAGMTEPLVRLDLLDCPGARVIQDKRGTAIEFSAAKLLERRYDHADAPPYGFRLQLKPFVQLTTFNYPR